MNQADALTYLRTNAQILPDVVQKTVNHVIDDERFQLFPASIEKHHAYTGGLLVHTAEVLDIALNMASSTGLAVDKTIIIPAVIYHDYGKIWDYNVQDCAKYDKMCLNYRNGQLLMVNAAEVWGKAPHRHVIRHPARSYADWMELSRKEGVCAYNGSISRGMEYQEKVAHCILAHHGRVEWNSPVEPQSAEAYVIHFADMLSARYGVEAPKIV